MVDSTVYNINFTFLNLTLYLIVILYFYAYYVPIKILKQLIFIKFFILLKAISQ